MKIAIMGAGALGSVIGAILSKKNDVLLIARGEHLRRLKKSGLKVGGVIRGVYNLEAENSYPGGYDLIIFTVKAYQTKEAVNLIKKEYSGEMVITLQNGIGPVDLLSEFDVIPGSTNIGATLIEPGYVELTGIGATYIGEKNGSITSRVKTIASNFTDCGLKTEAVGDIISKRWIKAAVNACINPLSAILRIKNGSLLDDNLMEIVSCVATECEAVLREHGVYVDVLEEVKKVIKNTSSNKSSMLQDIKNGKKTEIDYISGPFIAGNCNRTLYNMIKFLEDEFRNNF